MDFALVSTGGDEGCSTPPVRALFALPEPRPGVAHVFLPLAGLSASLVLMVWTLSPSLLFLPLVELDYRIFMHTEKKKERGSGHRRPQSIHCENGTLQVLRLVRITVGR